MKQEEQLISFNSAVPRFQSNASHQIRLLPGIEGTPQTVDFVFKKDQKSIGPGTYSIDSRSSVVNPARPSFGSSDPREKHNFLAAHLKTSLGQAGQTQVQSSVVKKTYNATLKNN